MADAVWVIKERQNYCTVVKRGEVFSMNINKLLV